MYSQSSMHQAYHMIMGLLEIALNYVYLPRRGVQNMAFHKGFQVELRRDEDHLLPALRVVPNYR